MNRKTTSANDTRQQDGAPCYRWEGDTLVLNVLGTAGAKRDAIGKAMGGRLKVSVTAAPEAGKATKAMARFLAKSFGVPAAGIELVYGETSRNKQFRINAPAKLPPGIHRDRR